ncbi:MAG: phosphoglycolate phosphatase [Oceanospirillaceae bacterium]|nr:phosphoglycolate phosphatase [Oceanospirillaceae bacterium]MCP5350267.1 phosphoglycolate phosphatase [Oceanospirillaceae bacterium]
MLEAKLVIFDLDGTLIDSVPDLAVAVDNMLAHFQLPPAGLDNVRHWVGNGSLKLVERALMHAQQHADNLAAAHAVFLQAYGDTHHAYSRLYPGVPQLLAALAEQDIKLAIATNKPQQFILPILQAFKIEQYFDWIVGGDFLAVRKPDPYHLFYICEKAGMPPTDAIMVGDSKADIDAANAALMDNILLRQGYGQGMDLSGLGAMLVLDDIEALRKHWCLNTHTIE